MHATSPSALPIVAATVSLLVAVLIPLAVPSAVAAARWQRPVPGAVARTFEYTRAAPFTAGAHRGADLAAPVGAPVRAACDGLVVHAGVVATQGGVVSVRCGARRVSYLPLTAIAVRAGARVGAGAPLGRLAPGHGGLHLGVRREADRFGYEDPLALITAPPSVPTLLPRRLGPRRLEPRRIGPRRPVPRRVGPRRLAPHRLDPRHDDRRAGAPRVPARHRQHRPQSIDAPAPGEVRGATPRAAPAPETRRDAPAPAGLAPWPVWLGLALLLTGAAGSTTIARRRQRQRRVARAASLVPRSSA